VTAAGAANLSLHIKAAKASFEVEPRSRRSASGNAVAAPSSGYRKGIEPAGQFNLRLDRNQIRMRF
jgi:hypothetical protein